MAPLGRIHGTLALNHAKGPPVTFTPTEGGEQRSSDARKRAATAASPADEAARASVDATAAAAARRAELEQQLLPGGRRSLHRNVQPCNAG